MGAEQHHFDTLYHAVALELDDTRAGHRR